MLSSKSSILADAAAAGSTALQLCEETLKAATVYGVVEPQLAKTRLIFQFENKRHLICGTNAKRAKKLQSVDVFRKYKTILARSAEILS